MKATRLILLSCASSAAIALPAQAQDAANSAASSPPEAVPYDAQGIGDIIVTATKRAENLQKTPIAISAFSAETLAASRIDSVKDLNVSTTALSISTNGLGQTIYLRGVGSSDASPGQEAPVALYIDNVYQPTTQSNNVPFSNVERVEVLKGPQGTLFGRNATGGLIHVITKDPTQELSGNFSLGYGNYQSVTAKGYLAGGLAEGLRADISGYYFDRAKGFGRNINTGNEIYKDRIGAVRSKVVAEPTDGLKITLIGDYSNQKTSTTYNYRLVPGTKPLTFPGEPLYTSTPGFYDVNANIDPLAKIRTWSANGRIEYDLGFATLTSQTSYQKVRITPNRQTPSAVPLSIVTADFIKSINNTFQQEFQLASNPGSPFRWIAGAYYLDMKGGSAGPAGIKLSGLGVVGGIPVPGVQSVDIIGVVDSKSYAAFAEVTYEFLPRTTLTLGGRYTIDKRFLHGSQELDSSATVYSPIPGTRTAFGSVDSTFGPASQYHSTYKEPSYRAILNHDFADDIMAYASFSHGFKSGNYNTVNPANPPYSPEKLNAYEVGFKSRFLNRSLQLNAAAFYYDYSNLQLQVNVGPTLVTINAAKAKIKGFEFDLTAKPARNLRFNVGYSYLDAKYGDFPGAVCYFPNNTPPTATAPGYGNVQGNCLTDFNLNLKGHRIVRTPEYQINLTGDYMIPSSIGDFDITATYFFTSSFSYVPSGRLFEPDYGLLNSSIKWNTPINGTTVSIWGKNLLNKKYTNFQTEQSINDIQVASPPRTYGIEIGYKF